MSKESNCVRCNKHPKKAGESVCKVCYDSGSGYFDMVGNDLADYFEWPDDNDAEEFGAESKLTKEEIIEYLSSNSADYLNDGLYYKVNEDTWTLCDLFIRQYLNNLVDGFGMVNVKEVYQYLCKHKDLLIEYNMVSKDGWNNSGLTLWENYNFDDNLERFGAECEHVPILGDIIEETDDEIITEMTCELCGAEGTHYMDSDFNDLGSEWDAEEFGAEEFEAQQFYENCSDNQFEIFGRKLYYKCRNVGSVMNQKVSDFGDGGLGSYKGGQYALRLAGGMKKYDIMNTLAEVSNDMKPDTMADWQGVVSATNQIISAGMAQRRVKG